jgi:tRNA(Arg) A34 adenosine deaminase TadA
VTAEDDIRYMRLAIAASREAVRDGNAPYGAVLVAATGELLQVSKNNQVTSGDSTGHAEVVLIREAAAKHGPGKLVGATVYASGEPCAMCAGALFWAQVGRLVYGMKTETIMRIGGEPTLAMSSARVLATGSRIVKVDGPLLEDEAAAVLALARRGAPPIAG